MNDDIIQRVLALEKQVAKLSTIEFPAAGSGSGIAPSDATYITQTPNANLSAEQALSLLATGYLKNTTVTGVVSVQAVPIPAADGGIGLASYAIGDLIQATGATTFARLASVAAGNVLISGGVTTISSWGKVGLTTHVSGTLPIANGGTSGTTALAAFNALSPVTTRGDLIIRDATNNVRLAIGTTGKYLRSDGTDPSWQAIAYTDLTYSGLTTGQPLRATSATTAAFGALDLAGTSVVNGLLPGTFGGTGVNNSTNTLTFTGTGTLALSTFTGTLPATGTFGLLGTAQTWSANNTFSARASVGGSIQSFAELSVGTSALLAGTAQVGIFATQVGNSAATAAIRGIQFSVGTAASAFTCTELTGCLQQTPTLGAGSSVTRYIGYLASLNTAVGTNNTGVIVHSSSTDNSFTGNWAFYGKAVLPSYFGDGITIGGTSFGTSATNTIALKSGVAPSTSPTDVVQIYSNDTNSVASKAGVHIRSEDGTSHVFGDKVGLGTIVPTQDLSFDGTAARVWWMERHTTANTAGNTLTIQAGGATSAATDKAGGNVIISPGASTGTGRVNARIKGYTVATATGTSDNTQIDRLLIGLFKALTNNTAITVVNVTVASNTVAAGELHYAVEVFNGTDLQVEEGIVSYHVTNKAGTIANNTIVKSSNQQAAISGTLTVTWAISAANPALLSVNANSSLTPSAGYPRVTYTLHNLTQQAVAEQ